MLLLCLDRCSIMLGYKIKILMLLFTTNRLIISTGNTYPHNRYHWRQIWGQLPHRLCHFSCVISAGLRLICEREDQNLPALSVLRGLNVEHPAYCLPTVNQLQLWLFTSRTATAQICVWIKTVFRRPSNETKISTSSQLSHPDRSTGGVLTTELRELQRPWTLELSARK